MRHSATRVAAFGAPKCSSVHRSTRPPPPPPASHPQPLPFDHSIGNTQLPALRLSPLVAEPPVSSVLGCVRVARRQVFFAVALFGVSHHSSKRVGTRTDSKLIFSTVDSVHYAGLLEAVSVRTSGRSAPFGRWVSGPRALPSDSHLVTICPAKACLSLTTLPLPSSGPHPILSRVSQSVPTQPPSRAIIWVCDHAPPGINPLLADSCICSLIRSFVAATSLIIAPASPISHPPFPGTRFVTLSLGVCLCSVGFRGPFAARRRPFPSCIPWE